MRASKLHILFVLCAVLLVLSVSSCEKHIQQEYIYDNIIFEIDTAAIYSSGTEKTKLKTTGQFISTMYSDLFREPISSETLLELTILRISIGDKMMVNEMILSNFLQDSQVQGTIPSASEMFEDPDQFIQETYLRFYLRKPTAYEKLFFTNLIEEDETLYPEIMYRAFILADEYMFY